jgi:hypothetical protein
MLNSRIVSALLVLISSLLAAIIMLQLSENDSWLAFALWFVFFVALSSPIFLSRNVRQSCFGWLRHLRGGI